jgi:anhydro-N-acetylmuramic acid kinase
VVGCMSGTSLDAIDAALVEIDGKGLEMRARFVRGTSHPLKSLGTLLRPLTESRPRPLSDVTRYAVMIGMSHQVAIRRLLDGHGVAPDLIGVHGQTVFHEPPNSMQLINPHSIAMEFRVPVAFDFRGADLAAGGTGAPITPLADHILFRDEKESRAVLNLGGFANYTWLPATRRQGGDALGSIRGADICSCNQLLDYIARRWFKERYDPGGSRAARGIVHPEAEEFLSMMLQGQSERQRSLGTGDEATEWPRTFQHHCNGEDLAATACAVIGQVIGTTLGEAERVIIGGGGGQNKTLLDGIRAHCRAEIVDSDRLGVPAQYREAVCMAVLTALAADGVPITLPQVTGRFKDHNTFPCWIRP